jgi:hypothetical protein
MANTEQEKAFWAKEGLIQRLQEENAAHQREIEQLTMEVQNQQWSREYLIKDKAKQEDEIKRQVEMIGILSVSNDIMVEFIQSQKLSGKFQRFMEQLSMQLEQ